MEKLKTAFKLLLSPIVLGILLTLTLVAIAFSYYAEKNRISKDSEHTAILKGLKIIDEKSIDLRLSSRGPRFGSPDVGLLTVDEKAVSTVGRWPWPRETTAKAIDNAIKWGAKVLAFDMVFSEPSSNPLQEVYDNLESRDLLKGPLKSQLQIELEQRNSDEKFSKVLAKHADKVVAGSFFYDSNNYSAMGDALYGMAHIQICRKWVFEQTQQFLAWDKEEEFVAFSESGSIYIPDPIIDYYKGYLKEVIEKEIRSKYPLEMSNSEIIEFNNEVLIAKDDFCVNWLDPSSDVLYENTQAMWPNIIEQIDEDDEFPFETFEDFANHIMARSYVPHVIEATTWVMNTPMIALGTKHTGFFNAQQDMDGTIRRSRLFVRSGNMYMPSIALKAFLVANNYSASLTLTDDPRRPFIKGINEFSLIDNDTGENVADYNIPLDREGLLTINYAGPRQMFPYISLADMLNDSETMEVEQMQFKKGTDTLSDQAVKKIVNKKEFLKGKYLIVGATAMGIFDLRVTPFDENYPGAETHVNVLDNLLRKDFLRTHPLEREYMMGIMLVIGILLSLLLTKLGAVHGLLLTSFFFMGISLFDKYYLFERGTLVSIIFPLALTALLYVFLTFYKYFTEERNKKELRSTFQKYVSPAIVDEVLKNPKNLELGGKKENITVLFSDIRGFTTISEKLDPRALSDLLNSYLTPMTDLVFEHRGTLDKYMGDAVMAFFGAPIHYEEHPLHACRCALHMLEKLGELQIEYKKQGLPEIDIGIGLNSGECSVGNMGSQTVRSYTVMGDSVNLGSRLEGINKQYGTRIIISEFTHEKVKDNFTCREIDLVRVKGKVLPVRIFELVSEGPASDTEMKKLEHFNKGYDLFHQKEFAAAIEQFNNALNINPDDFCSKMYIDRCQNYINTPPPEDWDGVFIMTTK